MNTFTPILEGILQRKVDFPTNIIVAYSVAIQHHYTVHIISLIMHIILV